MPRHHYAERNDAVNAQSGAAVGPADFKAVDMPPAIEGAAGDALEVALPAVTLRINVCHRAFAAVGTL
jgi:hypothetical protein